MRRVKDYNSFLNENLGAQKAVKTMKSILFSEKRDIKSKSEAEIKSSFEEGEGVWDAFTWDDKKGGYVGPSPIFSGDVLIKELDDDGDSIRSYSVISGLNQGIGGSFTWAGSGENGKYPVYEKPTGKNWEDLLGPDQNFLEKFNNGGYRWATSLSELDGVTIKKINEKGVCEFEYADIFQFYGNVRVYYTGPSTGSDFENGYYSYEVKDGPNKGTKGKGFQIFDKTLISEKTGVYSPFSNGDSTLNVIEYPGNIGQESSIKAGLLSGGKGINPFQFIFFNTSSSVSIIKGPTKEIFDTLHGVTKKYDPSEAEKSLSSSFCGNVIFGKVEKSKIGQTTIYAIQGTKSPVYFKGDQFPSLDGIETSECYISHYQGHPLILYSVKCQKKDKPSFDNKGVGTYGNRFFSGRFYDRSSDSSYQVRGEWYYDYPSGEVGILYAYKVSDKKSIGSIENSLYVVSTLKDVEKIDFSDPKNPTGIVKDQTGGSWPEPMKMPDIDLKKWNWKDIPKK